MKEFFYLSADGRTQIRAACWEPPCAPRAVLQFVHGMYEHMGWYDRFARWLAAQGFLPFLLISVAHDIYDLVTAWSVEKDMRNLIIFRSITVINRQTPEIINYPQILVDDVLLSGSGIFCREYVQFFL